MAEGGGVVRLTTTGGIPKPGPEIVDVLVQFIETSFGLLDDLYSDGVLEDEQCESIRHESQSEIQRSKRLLDYLDWSHHGDRFLKALRDNNQNHIENFILKKHDDSVRILDVVERARLKTRYADLVKSIDPTVDLIIDLFSDDCISDQHRDYIEGGCSRNDKNRRLLEIVKRRSFFDVRKFFSYVAKYQCHIVSPLTEADTPLVQFHATFDRLPNGSENEGQFVDYFNSLPIHQQKEFLQTLQNQYNINVQTTEMQRSSSIDIFVACASIEDLRRLKTIFDSGVLKAVLEQMLSALLPAKIAVVIAKLEWIDVKYHSCLRTAGDTDRIPEKSFPTEVLEVILVRTALLYRNRFRCDLHDFSSEKKTKRRRCPESMALYLLSAVCKEWCDILSGCQRKLRKYFKKKTFKRSVPVEVLRAVIISREKLRRQPLVRDPPVIQGLLLPSEESPKSESKQAQAAVKHTPSEVSKAMRSKMPSDGDVVSATDRKLKGSVETQPFDRGIISLAADDIPRSLKKFVIKTEEIRLLFNLASVSVAWWQFLSVDNAGRKCLKRAFHLRPQLLLHLSASNVSSVMQSARVSSVTQSAKYIFVVKKRSDAVDAIEVYVNSGVYERLDDIKASDNIHDVAVSSELNKLYVLLDSKAAIWHMQIKDLVRSRDKLKKFRSFDFMPDRISITSRRLLVLPVCSSSTGDVKLHVYSCSSDNSSQLVAVVGVDLSNFTPRDAAENVVRRTIVVCGITRDRSPIGKVIEIDVAGGGQVIRWFDNPNHLIRPLHVTLDSKGNVIVADWKLQHVILLNPDLQFVRILLDKRRDNFGKRHPFETSYVETVKGTRKFILALVDDQGDSAICVYDYTLVV